MSILIKGMEMPTDKPLTLVIYPDGTVANVYEEQRGTAIPVPTPHGRLIDTNDLLPDMCVCGEFRDIWGFSKDMINNAPTVIEAEPPKEKQSVDT